MLSLANLRRDFLVGGLEESFEIGAGAPEAFVEAGEEGVGQRVLKIPPSKRINASRLEVMGHWRNWPADACREFERICQPMMREYGYGNEPEWLAKLSSSPR